MSLLVMFSEQHIPAVWESADELQLSACLMVVGLTVSPF